jgi:hypothetical protein
MARNIEVECPTDGYRWTVDLDTLQTTEIVYRGLMEKGGRPKTRVESYRVRCPHDGTWVVVEVETEE